LVIFQSRGQHTISVASGDTVLLEVDEWHGQLQWQLSYDKISWMNIPGRIYDTIKYVPDQFPSYFRVKITDGECSPHYTEAIEVLEGVVTPGAPVVTSVEPYSVAAASAVTGGVVTSTGDSPVTKRGVVYGTAPNPDVDSDFVVSSGSGGGSFEVIVSGLSPNTTYYVRAFATNSEGTSYGKEFTFTTIENKVYSIGEEGPAGGIVYYDKGFYSDGWRYLEAAPKGWAGTFDPWVDLEWGCYQTLVGGTSTAIGTGKENTDLILAKGCAGPETAVQLAANASINGYNDWFLPSRDELREIYDNLFNLVPNFHLTYGFGAMTYTSSSEIDAISSWGVAFGSGTNTEDIKIIATIAVRPVRRF
jgi:hypothetical protein